MGGRWGEGVQGRRESKIIDFSSHYYFNVSSSESGIPEPISAGAYRADISQGLQFGYELRIPELIGVRDFRVYVTREF